MNKTTQVIVLAASIIVAGLIGYFVATEKSTGDELSPQLTVLLEQAQERAARLDPDSLYVTATGPGLEIEGWSPDVDGDATRQDRVPDDIVSRILDRSDRERFVLTLPSPTLPDSMVVVSLDRESPEEGRAFRLLLARPTLGNSLESAPLWVVIGHYGAMWSEAAVGGDALPCVLCGEILVCGSNPKCGR